MFHNQLPLMLSQINKKKQQLINEWCPHLYDSLNKGHVTYLSYKNCDDNDHFVKKMKMKTKTIYVKSYEWMVFYEWNLICYWGLFSFFVFYFTDNTFCKSIFLKGFICLKILVVWMPSGYASIVVVEKKKKNSKKKEKKNKRNVKLLANIEFATWEYWLTTHPIT